jgi:hypothetical protein
MLNYSYNNFRNSICFLYHPICLEHLKKSDRISVFKLHMTVISFETLFYVTKHRRLYWGIIFFKLKKLEGNLFLSKCLYICTHSTPVKTKRQLLWCIISKLSILKLSFDARWTSFPYIKFSHGNIFFL